MPNNTFRRIPSGRLSSASFYKGRKGDSQAPIAAQFFTYAASTPVTRPSLSTRVLATSQSTAVASLTTASRTTLGGTGSVMFIAAAMTTPGTAPTVSDSKANTWTLVSSGARPSVGGSYYLWRCVTPTGGTGHTFTVTYNGGTSPLTMIALEAVNCQNDVTGAFTLDSAVPFTSSITTTGANDLVLVFNSSDTSSYSSPFNIGETYIDPSTGWSLSHGWAEGLPAAAYTVTIPAGASSDMQVISVALKSSATGNTFNDTLSEAVAAADALSTTQIFAGSLSESIAASDTDAGTMSTSGTVAESVAAADSLAGGLLLPNALSESVAPGDSASAAQTLPNTLAESLAPADALSSAQTAASSLAESVAAADALASAQTMASTLAESATLGDSVTSGSIYSDVLSEAVAPADSSSTAQTFAAALSEAAAPADAVTSSQAMASGVAESIAAADAAGSALVAVAALSETATPADAVADTTGGTTYNEALSEGVALTDGQTFTWSGTDPFIAVISGYIARRRKQLDDEQRRAEQLVQQITAQAAPARAAKPRRIPLAQLVGADAAAQIQGRPGELIAAAYDRQHQQQAATARERAARAQARRRADDEAVLMMF